MTRHSEVNRQTEVVYKTIADQFNPGLRSFLSAGRTYERALSNVTVAAKSYFNSLVKLGEMASSSKASQEMGDSLFQMAELHRQIQLNMEEAVKSLRGELLIPLEQKLDLDLKFLAATVKKLQSEHRTKAEVVEKFQGKLKKIRRRSQNSKRPIKYSEKETQLDETLSQRQSEYRAFVSESFRSALVEERRRFAFLVDRQCTVTQNFMEYHGKARDLLTSKLTAWRASCAEPGTVPEQSLRPLTTLLTSPLTPGVSTATVAAGDGGGDGAPPSPSPSTATAVAVATAVAGGDDDASVVDLVARGDGKEEPAVAMETDSAPPPAPPTTSTPKPTTDSTPVRQDIYSNTMPSRKLTAERASILPEPRPRATSVRHVLRARVVALFPHAAPPSPGAPPPAEGVGGAPGAGGAGGGVAGGGGAGEGALLSFDEGDVITLLVPEAKGGWHYGECERSTRRGWFPFAYTQLIEPGTVPVARGGSQFALNPESVGEKPRPYSIAVSGEFNLDKGMNGFNSSSTFLRGANPFASVKLKPTKTNDRSAPAIT